VLVYWVAGTCDDTGELSKPVFRRFSFHDCNQLREFQRFKCSNNSGANRKIEYISFSGGHYNVVYPHSNNVLATDKDGGVIFPEGQYIEKRVVSDGKSLLLTGIVSTLHQTSSILCLLEFILTCLRLCGLCC
jgi:hypothetical protein